MSERNKRGKKKKKEKKTVHSKSRKIAKYSSPSLKLKVNYYWDSLGTTSIKKKKTKRKITVIIVIVEENFIEIFF